MSVDLSTEQEQEIERIDLPPVAGVGTGPRLVGGVARIVPQSWLRRHVSIRGRMVMVYPGRVWIRGDIRTRHPQPGELVRVWYAPESTSHATTTTGQKGSWKKTIDIKHSLGAPRVWPELTAQSRVKSILLNRRETIIELEVFPEQEGWVRLLRLYGELRNTTGLRR